MSGEERKGGIDKMREIFSITKEKTPPLRTINKFNPKSLFFYLSLGGEKKNIPSIGSINPYFINLTRILPQILDMPQQMPLSILTYQIPKIRSQAHVRRRRFLNPPLVNGEPAEEDEAPSIENRFACLRQQGREKWERESILFSGRNHR